MLVAVSVRVGEVTESGPGGGIALALNVSGVASTAIGLTGGGAETLICKDGAVTDSAFIASELFLSAIAFPSLTGPCAAEKLSLLDVTLIFDGGGAAVTLIWSATA